MNDMKLIAHLPALDVEITRQPGASQDGLDGLKVRLVLNPSLDFFGKAIAQFPLTPLDGFRMWQGMMAASLTPWLGLAGYGLNSGGPEKKEKK